jgi:hypothetical protein
MADIFDVEKIKSHTYIDGEIHYFIKWRGYPETHNTYEPSVNIIDKTLIRDYNNELRNKRGNKRWGIE